VQATFDDDGTDLPYLDAVMDYSDGFLFNSWTVNGTSSTSQSSSDTASVARYGKRSGTLQIVFDASGADGANILSCLLPKYATPMQRITSITPNMGDPETMRVCFARELLDKIEVFRTPPGGGARLDQVSFIQNITWSGEPGVLPSLVLGISPL
jgi:hypothetical protein